MTRRPYKVNKTWLLWDISCLSKLSSPSSHLVCSILLPITLGTTGTWRTSGILFFLWGWSQTHCEQGRKPLQPPWLQRRQVGHECMHVAPWGGETGPGGTKGGGHICHMTATDILLHLHVQPAVLWLSMWVWLSQPSLAGDTCIAPGALGTHTPCFTPSCAASTPCLGPSSPQSSGCPHPPGRTLA